MLENRRGYRDFVVAGVGSRIPHLEILVTTHLAHVHHQAMKTWSKELIMARPLLFTVAAVVVDDPLAVQVQEGAVVRRSVEPVVA